MRASMTLAFLLTALCAAGGPAGQPGDATIQGILLDRSLWGRDYAALLPQLRALTEAGETTAYVFPERATGGTAFATAGAAQARVQRVRAAGARPAALQPAFAALQPSATAQPPLAVAADRTIDGDGYHVVLARTAAVEFLAPGLTVAALRGRLGEPQRIVQQTIQGIGDRKPVILTLYVYAGGAIAFAESNMAEPGTIARAVLNLPQVVAAVSR